MEMLSATPFSPTFARPEAGSKTIRNTNVFRRVWMDVLEIEDSSVHGRERKMLLRMLEEKYGVNATAEEASARVQKALDEVGLKNLAVRKHVPPGYLLMEYSPSWVGKTLEIECLFKETDKGTEITVKWPFYMELPAENEVPLAFRMQQEESLRKTKQLIEEFKKKIGATSIT